MAAVKRRGPRVRQVAACTAVFWPYLQLAVTQPTSQARILVVDDEPSLREFLAICLGRCGHEVVTAQNGAEAIHLLNAAQDQAGIASERGSGSKNIDLVISDLTMPGVDGLEVLRHARGQSPPIDVIIMTAYATTDSAVEAMKAGAQDYLIKPFKVDELLLVVARALEKRALTAENLALRAHLSQGERLDQMIGRSVAMQRVFELIRRIAPTPANVLIIGESGTGKELVARALHNLSPQANSPWVPVNCAAIPTNLLESELFGHKKGAFTGAQSDRKGMFELAGDGTIFLDEIGEIDVSMQAKLLRVLQERRVRPVGASQEIPVGCRIVAATNRDLQAAVERGEFRNDLYFRLNVIQVNLAPLRHRPQDIAPLVEHFFAVAKAKMNKPHLGMTREAMSRFVAYTYPGNIRELQNLVERAVALESSDRLSAENLPACAPLPQLPANDTSANPVRSPEGQVALATSPTHGTIAGTDTSLAVPDAAVDRWPELGITLEHVLSDIERRLLTSALESSKGVRKDAARLLGITMRSLRYRLDKLGLENDPEWTAKDDLGEEHSKPPTGRAK